MTILTVSTKIYRDGREVCLKSSAGQQEYKRRREQMYERDDGMCCICGGKIRTLQEATFEHKNGRGMGGSRRDDRIEKNGVAHWRCNTEQGSKRYVGPTAKDRAAIPGQGLPDNECRETEEIPGTR